MNRRSFVVGLMGSIVGLFGFGKVFASMNKDPKDNPNNLPVAKFGANGICCNNEELFKDIPLIAGSGAGSRSTFVWISKENMLIIGPCTFFWGEALVEEVMPIVVNEVYGLFKPTEKSYRQQTCNTFYSAYLLNHFAAEMR